MAFHSDSVNYDNMSWSAMTEEERELAKAEFKTKNEEEMRKYRMSNEYEIHKKQEEEQKQAFELIRPALEGLYETKYGKKVSEDSMKFNARMGGTVSGVKCIATSYSEDWDIPTTEVGVTENEYIVVLYSRDMHEKIIRAPR